MENEKAMEQSRVLNAVRKLEKDYGFARVN